MLVHRIEDKNKEGVYSSKIGYDLDFLALCNDKNHPLPCSDNLLKKTHYLRTNNAFAFSSIEQLKKWFCFDSWLKELDRAGFILSIYDVPIAYYGESQACFPLVFLADCYLVERKKLTEI